ncbi:bifunctional metallophosphatase/5'-nucleotidase [Paenibacillus sp. CAU 1782]
MAKEIETAVVLLHSNDIHSRLENAARIASIIEEEKGLWGADRVLAVDCGDHMDRMRLETEGSGGEVNIRLLEEAGYEAVTLGNNEGLTYSIHELEQRFADSAGFAVICANMKLEPDGDSPSWLKPSTVIVKNGLRFGVIAATADYRPFYKLLGWQSSDPLEAIAAEVQKLRSKCDTIVVLSHLGLLNDRKMAEEIDGIDLILGGHTHHLLQEPEMINGTAVCAAGKFGEHVGRIEIGRRTEDGSLVYSCSVIPTAAYAENPEASSIISRYRISAGKQLSRIIATLEEALPASADRETPLPNLLAAGIRRWTNAEVSLVNNGQLLGGLAIGDATAGDLHALCPSPINPCVMKLYGSHIRTALEQSLLPEFYDMPLKGYGFRGKVLGMLAVDGMEIDYDPAKPPMEKLTKVLIGGQPMEDSRQYTVGSLDMFSFRIGYESLAEGEDYQFFLPEFIRDVLERELCDKSALQLCKKKRWNRM